MSYYTDFLAIVKNIVSINTHQTHWFRNVKLKLYLFNVQAYFQTIFNCLYHTPDNYAYLDDLWQKNNFNNFTSFNGRDFVVNVAMQQGPHTLVSAQGEIVYIRGDGRDLLRLNDIVYCAYYYSERYNVSITKKLAKLALNAEDGSEQDEYDNSGRNRHKRRFQSPHSINCPENIINFKFIEHCRDPRLRVVVSMIDREKYFESLNKYFRNMCEKIHNLSNKYFYYCVQKRDCI